MPLGKCSASVDRVTGLSGELVSPGGNRPPGVPRRHQGGCLHRKNWPARKFNQTAGREVPPQSAPDGGTVAPPCSTVSLSHPCGVCCATDTTQGSRRQKHTTPKQTPYTL